MDSQKAKVQWWMPVLGVVLLIGVSLGIWAYLGHQERLEQQRAADALFEPIEAAVEEAKAEPRYDIDRTVQVIHGLDSALDAQGSLEDYLKYMARQDYRGVAPDVLEARLKVLSILKRLYATQTKLENQESTFTVTRTVLSALSLAKADVDIMSGVMPSLDAEQAKTVLEDLRKDQAIKKELLDELAELEVELISVMTDYSEVYYKYIAEWDKLVLLRDRAYLAAAEGQWATAASAADKAIEMAPQETEAHLLKARALIETIQTPESQNLEQAVTLLGEYMQENPDRSAPALLLLGVAYERMGRMDDARLNYQQAAAYYPKQAEVLSDMMDPYEVRGFLRKSREGRIILDQYSATMLGAGYFSPDLHMARVSFLAGDMEEGKKKVLDHFSRRRNQASWDLVLNDIEFCESYLGAYFDGLFVEDSHLFLEAKPTLIGSKLDVSVKNQSPKPLHNATLLLAVRFTDMHRDDFEVFKVGETVPVVTEHATTNFGSLTVEYPLFGQTRGVDDIVLTRAILLTDTAVVWVDSDEHRLALARTGENTPAPEERKTWFDVMKVDPEMLTGLLNSSDVGLDLSLGRDDVTLKLPRELSILKPSFRLHDEGQTFAPEINKLNEDGIELRFDSVRNFEGDGVSSANPVVKIHTRFGDFDVTIDWKNRRIGGVDFVAR